MIHYQLRCDQGHAFDSWFRDSAGFDLQVQRGLVACPECGGTKVGRALMAPAIAKGRTQTVAEQGAPATPTAPAPQTMATDLPDQVRAALQRIRAEVERNSDYVGPAFADEARRIHNGESEKRSIYGESTPEQAHSLAEDGIEVMRIPWVPRADG